MWKYTNTNKDQHTVTTRGVHNIHCMFLNEDFVGLYLRYNSVLFTVVRKEIHKWFPQISTLGDPRTCTGNLVANTVNIFASLRSIMDPIASLLCNFYKSTRLINKIQFVEHISVCPVGWFYGACVRSTPNSYGKSSARYLLVAKACRCLVIEVRTERWISRIATSDFQSSQGCSPQPV